MSVLPQGDRLLPVAEALAIVLSQAQPLAPVRLKLADALGLVLAEEIRADLDLPPFDKSIVDGYAVRSSDFSDGENHTLDVVEEIFAGRVPTRSVGSGQTAMIMTGAPLPDGSDAVVMVEKCNRVSANSVTVPAPVRPGQNRMLRGTEIRTGDTVVGAGTILNATKLGALASVGASEPLVFPRARVAVISTGDEVVPHGQTPGPGQIRNSNSLLLEGIVREHAAIPNVFPIVPDLPESLQQAFAAATTDADILLISGGVSAGKRDLVPAALEAVGVRPLFHKVKVKPGKPLWFGVGPVRKNGRSTLVFGLPGNPVSGLVSFLLFVRQALRVLHGLEPLVTPTVALPLVAEYRQQDDRDTYRPARLVQNPGEAELRVQTYTWAGSSDLRGVTEADGFVMFAAGERIYECGERVPFLPHHPSRFGLGQTY